VKSLTLLWLGLLGCAGSVAADVLRAAVVPIVNQEHFLERVLAPWAAERGLRLEIKAVHGREVARAARAGEVDLVIMHTRFPGRERLIADHVIADSREVFANPVALLAPAHDPAGVAGAGSAAEAMSRIRAAGACVLENDLDGLVMLTRRLAGDDACYVRDPSAVGLGAVLKATRDGHYTWWGLHPFAMSDQSLRPLVWPEPDLLRPLAAAPVIGADGDALARAAIAYLRTPAARADIVAFRLTRAPTLQAWYPLP
jgi:hypothetical protein